ncbi:MAG: hypothetical protein NW237_17810 [Cyanobacteriota bacterium]|nr:hypothetical protein [Cyanobacteriota bacterium]
MQNRLPSYLATYLGLILTFCLLVTGCGGSPTGVANSPFSDNIAPTSLEVDPKANPSAYNIQVRFPDNSLSAGQQQIFTEAAAKWETIITGDLPDVRFIRRRGAGGCVARFTAQVVDDILIDATAPSIDGVGGILGQAGPCYLRNDSQLTIYGIMEFDSADLANLQSTGYLDAVILHEMGHVLGLGTLWDTFGLLEGSEPFPVIQPTPNPSPSPGYNPRYIGASGVAQYKILSGPDDDIPVEDCEDLPDAQRSTCGAGTRDGHWKESIFDNELMTGYLNAANGGSRPLSIISAGHFADMGYQVNVGAADDYSLPDAKLARRREWGSWLALPSDILRFPLTLVDRDGNDVGILDSRR